MIFACIVFSYFSKYYFNNNILLIILLIFIFKLDIFPDVIGGDDGPFGVAWVCVAN